jgi:hypothetical protein
MLTNTRDLPRQNQERERERFEDRFYVRLFVYAMICTQQRKLQTDD